MRGFPPTSSAPYCKFCGCFIGNQATHKMWHKAMDSLVRRVVRPKMTEEEWIEFTNTPEFILFSAAEVSKQVAEIEVVEELESITQKSAVPEVHS